LRGERIEHLFLFVAVRMGLVVVEPHALAARIAREARDPTRR
jgi:hypothetical protein